MNPKVLIILLVLVVVLFVVGLGLGLGRDDANQGVSLPSWREQVVQRLAPRIEPREIYPVTLGCLQQGAIVVRPGTTCTVEVGDARWPVRTLRLRLEEGLAARLLLENLGERQRISPNPTVPDDNGEREVSLSILQDGARLHVTCQGGPSASPCRLAVAHD